MKSTVGGGLWGGEIVGVNGIGGCFPILDLPGDVSRVGGRADKKFRGCADVGGQASENFGDCLM